MIRIHPIHDSAELTEAFIRFGVDYPGRFDYLMPRFYKKESDFLRPDKNFFFKTGAFRGWVALDGERIVGRIGAMINPEMRCEHEATGLVGLFEAEPDYEITRLLLDEAALFLRQRGCGCIWGPMNFSIWQGYRFKVDCFDGETFIGEPQNPPYYPANFEKYGFRPAQEWESQLIEREGMDALCRQHRSQYDLFTRLGYQEEPLRYEKHLHVFWELLCHIFRDFPGFSPISEKDLLGLYEGLPHLIEKSVSFLFKDGRGEYVGFSLVLKEAVEALRAMRGKTDLIAKIKFKLKIDRVDTISYFLNGFKYNSLREALALGKSQGEPLSLGRAVLHLTLREALQSGRYSRALLPLMRQDVPARNLVKKHAGRTMHHRMYEMRL